MSLLTNALKVCWSSGRFSLNPSSALLLHIDRGNLLCDRLSALQDCVLRSASAATRTNLLMKKSVQKTVKYITKYPENAILMWIDSVPRAFRKKNTAANEEEFQSLYIHFLYCLPQSDTPIEVNLIRPLDELFLQTCDKIKEKINKFIVKQTKRLVFSEESNYEFVFSTPDHPNLLLSTNEQVYKDGNIVEIRINNDKYRILRNPPRCSKLALKLKPLVGCPLMASYTLADDSQEGLPSFHWYVGESDATLVTPTLDSTSGGEPKYSIDGWAYRSTGQCFCPGIEDIGKRVCVIFDMGTDTIAHCVVSDDVVAGISEPFIFENRQSTYCKQRASSGSVRLVSYNVLADLYLDLKLKEEDLYFPYCSKEYQDYAYRYPLLLREIPGYQGDIIFLQEVDERLWLRFLPEIMSSHGYDCYFRRKGLKVNEGLVICHRKGKFRHLESHDMWLPDFLNPEVYSENADVNELFESNEELKAMFTSKPAVIQLIALESNLSAVDDEDILLLANTHLYFDPRYEIIKVLQALLCARWIVHVAANYANRIPGARLHVLFAGDFNSTPDGAVYQLLSTGSISAKSDCITFSEHLRKDVTFFTRPPSTSFNLALTSLADESQFTNFTRHYRYDGQIAGFEGCLDYIWGSANVEVQRVIPMPPKELIKRYVALPSKIAPSDHLPLVCDVRLG